MLISFQMSWEQDMKELHELQPGDQVFVYSRHGKYLAKIDRVTKTQIILETAAKFRVKDGYLITDDSYNTTNIKHATDEEIENHKSIIRFKNKVRKISEFNFSQLDESELDQILAIIEKY